MDFECEDWDIGREASGLVSSLFQDTKNKNKRKRKNPKNDPAPNTVDSEVDHFVAKKLKHDAPTDVLQMSGGEKLSKKERKNLRRKRNKLQRKLMNIASAESDPVGSKTSNGPKKETQFVVGTSDLSNIKVQNNVKGKKKRKDKSDANVIDVAHSIKKSNNTTEVNLEKSEMKKSKVGNNVLNENKKTAESSPKKSDSVSVDSSGGASDLHKNTQSGSPKHKKKRKRTSKKNKFKGYVKPERKENPISVNSSPGSLSVPHSKTNQSVPKVESMSDSNKNKEKKTETNQDRKMTKAQDGKIKVDTCNNETLNSTSPKTNGDVVGKISKKKRNSMDPKVLNSILTKNTTETLDSPDKLPVQGSVMASGKSDVGKRSCDQSFLEKSKERLNAARFRYLNEQLYTTTGKEAFQLFKYDKTAFDVYHEGFQSQVQKWPSNPVDIIIKQMLSKPKHLILADFGCGDAKLARNVHQTVHSFDLVALNEHVTVCDMSKVPLKDGSVDIAIFCLSLMGTNLTLYLKEANRVLKSNATLIIAEVTSRFQSIGNFIMKVEKMGFKVKHQNSDNKMFVMMEFRKTFDCRNREVEDIKLKPCVYKKR